MNSRKGMNGAKATLGNLIASYWFYLFFAFAIIGLSVSSDLPGVASVMTDKPDYAPDETVTITGEGFAADSSVALSIEWPDEYLFTANPTTDPAGAFSFLYPLTSGPSGMGIDGYYFVEANDSVNFAETYFTDHRINTFNDAGFNNEDYLFQQGSTVYVKGDVGNANSMYFEYYNPGGVLTYTSVCKIPNGNNKVFDTLVLGASEATGSWLIHMKEFSSADCSGGVSGNDNELGRYRYFNVYSTSCAGPLLAPTKDSYVKQVFPDLNYGDKPNIKVNSQTSALERGYLQFDLTGISEAVAAAYLHMDQVSGTCGSVSVSLVDNAWTENGIDWNNAPVVFGTTSTDNVDGKLGGEIWDVTSLVQEAVVNDVISFGAHYPSENSDSSVPCHFNSRDSTLPQSPYLEIVYYCPTPTPSVSPSPTVEPSPSPTPEPTHLECVSFACVPVPGAGGDLCASDLDCLPQISPTPEPTHSACVGMTCTVVPGEGENSCATDLDCSYAACVFETCQQIEGDLPDECASDIECLTCEDLDGDGFSGTDAPQCGPLDCNDDNDAVYPGATESCNNVDDNCNQVIDEDLTQACGDGLCTGVSTCTAGNWGSCSSDGNDCDICGVCSQGVCGFDDGQSADCSIYDIDPIDTCTYDPDAIDVTLDTSDGFISQCTGLGTCSQSDGGEITHACDLSCGAECTPDDISACGPRLDDDLCMTGGSCTDSCACNYDVGEYCPLPGTVTDDICYYGEQTCTGDGCGLNDGSMQCDSFFDVFYAVCDPTLGPQDPSGPLVTTVVAYPDPTNQKINVNAMLTDTCTMINYSELYFDECGTPGTGIPIYPTDDGVFGGDKNQENVSKLNMLLATYGITDGRHTVYVRAQNTQGYWGACGFDVFEVDLLPPEIVRNITFGLPQLVCGRDPTLSVEFCDTQTPINQAEYFLDGDWDLLPNGAGLYMSATDGNFDELCEYTNATINLTTLDDGKHCIKFHAKDLAGNWGKMTFIDEICFIVDRTPPTTVKTVGEPKIMCEENVEDGVSECWFVNQSTEISMEAQDFIPEDGYYSNEVTTWFRIRYKFDYNSSWDAWGPWTEYDESFNIEEDSIHEIEYYSHDSCMNNETSQFEIDIVDSKYPITTKTVGEPKIACDPEDPMDCDYYITMQTPISFSCLDQDPHGVDDVKVYWRYDINGTGFTQWMLYNNEPFNFEEDSRHTIEYYCVDALGNQEPVQTEVDVVDTLEPQIIKEVSNPKVSCNEIPGEECHYYINQSTTISLTCLDQDPHPVGGEELFYMYCVNEGEVPFEIQDGVANCTEWLNYTAPFSFTEDSRHTLYYYCTDALGNSVRDIEFDVVDSQPPIVEKFVGEPKVACDPEDPMNCDYYITQSTPIDFRCVDQQPHPVGGQVIYLRYSINDGPWTEWDAFDPQNGSFYFTEDSRHTLEYMCVDALGNTNGIHSEVDVVDTQAPNTTKVVGDPKVACDPEDPQECDYYITQDTPITLSCADGDPHPVGGESIVYRYCVDDGEKEWCTEDFAYEGPFTFPQDSRHTLEYWCVDALGNEEEHQFEVDVVDSQAPGFEKIIGDPSIGREVCYTPNQPSTCEEGKSKTYTINSEFDEGTLFNVEYTSVADQLQLVLEGGTTYPVMWVANAGEDSLSKWDTENNKELARYHTWFGPLGSHSEWSGPAPSRTAVDSDGNVYVANRHFDGKPADVFKILADDYIDRNSNGVMDSSSDTSLNGEIEPGEMIQMTDTNGNDIIDPSEITDERVAWVSRVGTSGCVGRSLAIDLNGDIWLGCYNERAYYKLNGATGAVIYGPLSVSPHTPYGALVDQNGILWGASLTSNMLRMDTNNPETFGIIFHSGSNYGIAIADVGGFTHVYLAYAGAPYLEYDSQTMTFSDPATPDLYTLGIATDVDGSIVVGDASFGGAAKFAQNGSLIWNAPAQVASEARGVVVDSSGDVWVIHREADKLSKFSGIDGAPLGIFNSGLGPYTYSDAAGTGFRGSVSQGTWNVIYDADAADSPLGPVSWSDSVPEGTELTVKVRSSNDQLGWSAWEEVSDGVAFSSTPNGRYLEVQVSMKGTDTETPILYDLTVNSECVEDEVAPLFVEASAYDVGDNVSTITFPEGAGTGVGVAFDGEFLYYTYIYSTDLHKIRPDGTGHVMIETTGISETGLGALSYDATRGKIWAGTYGCDEDDGGPVYLIDPATGIAEYKFSIPDTYINYCLDDGIAYDAKDDSIWYSDDVSQYMVHMYANGTFIEVVDFCSMDSTDDYLCPGISNGNSGIAIGGENFYLGNNGGDTTTRYDRSFNFIDQFVNTDFRIEDMECDPNTFSPTEVMWVRDAYAGQARAYAIEPNTCGLGGQPPGGEVCEWVTYVNQSTEFTFLCQDGQPHPVDQVSIYYRTRWKENLEDTWGEWGQWIVFEGENTTFMFGEDSVHEVEYYCKDLLNNTAGSYFETDIVDSQGPTVEKEVGDPKVRCDAEDPMGCDWYITQQTPIYLTCTDGEPHPVDDSTIYYHYKINDGEFREWMVYEGPIYYQQDSRHTLEYMCVDALGNAGPLYTEVDVVDTQAPVTNKTVGDPKVSCGDVPDECDYYITQNTPISLSCADTEPHPVGGESIQYYYCVTDGDDPFCTEPVEYDGEFVFSEDSRHTLYYWCTDALGNEERAQIEYDVVDTQAPEIYKEVGDPSISCEEKDDPSCHYYITQNTQITLSCRDTEPHPVDHVQLSYRWRLDGGEWTQWIVDGESVSLNFSEDSVHEIEYKCADILGNEVSYTEIDRVDTTPPNTTKTVMGNHTACDVGDECDYYVCRDTRLTWDATDGGPICHVDGVKTYYRYLLDGYEWSEWFDFGESGDFYFEHMDEGIYFFEFYSDDALGNEEAMQYEIDIFDKQPPKGWVLNPVSGRYYHDGEQFSVYAPAYDKGNPASGIASCTFYAIDIHFEELVDDELAQVMWYIKNYNTLQDLMAFLGPDRYTLVPLGSVPYVDGVCKGVAQIPEDSGLTDKAYLVLELTDKSCNMYFDLARDSVKDPILMDIDNTPPFIELTGTEGLPGPLSKGDYFVAFLEATDYDSALFQCSGEIVQNECSVEGEGEVLDPIITPTSVEAWLFPGESVEEEKIVTTEETPITSVDVMFSLDLTGSMGDELDEAQSSAIQIMTDVNGLVADSQFGANSFMDYPHSYEDEVTNCGYSATYGDSESGDYAYNLDQDITSDTGDVSDAINALSLGYGADGPEAYVRALYESQFATWRSGSKRILVMFGDNVPHDCGFNGDSTGKDPGRDELVNTPDDLDFEDIVAQLVAEDISVISVDSGSDHAPWQYMSSQTGGQWFELNDADDIPSAIVSLIEQETSMIDTVTIDVQPGYEGWVEWTPFSYTNVTGNQTLSFQLTYTVPANTTAGDYVFWVRVVGDGSTLREQIITIHVPGVCEESEERHFDFDGEILSDHTCKVYGTVPEELEEGSHTLVLSAMDFEYNTGSIDTTLMVDNFGPEKEVISPLAGEVYSQIIPIELVAMDLSGVNPSTVQYRIFENVASLFGTSVGSEEYDSGWRVLPHMSGDTFGTDFNASFEGLEDGKTYYFRARACDTIFEGDLPNGAEIPEHCSDPETVFKIDMTNPTAPGSATISSCAMSWSASSDASGVELYKIYHDGSYVTSVTSLSYATACAVGEWSVSAVDVAGNEGDKSVATVPVPVIPAPVVNSPGSTGGQSSGPVNLPPAKKEFPKVTETSTDAIPAVGDGSSPNVVAIVPEDDEPAAPAVDAAVPKAVVFTQEPSPATGLVVGNMAPYLGVAMLGGLLLLIFFLKRRKKSGRNN